MSGTQRLEVEFSDTQDHIRVDHPRLRDLIVRALQAEGVRRAQLSIALMDDATIHELNRRHLGHDWPTDVVTFDLSDEDQSDVMVGELAVSTEMARRVALAGGFEPIDELVLYIVHGILHLRGYDDLEPSVRADMRRREVELMAHLGIPFAVPVDPAAAANDDFDSEGGTCSV